MSVSITLLLPTDGVYRDLLVGFHRFAVEWDWIFHHHSYPMDAREPMDPDVIVVTAETLHWLSADLRRKKIVISASADLTAEGIPSVVPDDAAIGQAAAAHLLERGLRSFAAHGYPQPFAHARGEAFRAAVEQEGRHFTGWGPRHDQTLPDSADQWIYEARRWLDAMPKPVGIFSCCDPWATRLLVDVRKAGLKIPDQVAVVSADNQRLVCELTIPTLSSVMVPWERMGEELAVLAEKLMRGQRAPDRPVRVPPGEVFVRRSSDAWAVADPAVAEALACIRAHAGSLIGVPDVVRASGTYRRNLERRFKKLIGHSIMQEIRRVHVEQAKRLLSATKLSVDEVAVRSGFPNAKILWEAFRRELGTSPRDYRQKYRLRG